MKELPYANIFDIEFLTALSNWQNGWRENQERRREIADKLVEQCNKLPHEFKVCDCPCYRKRFIIEGEIVPILLDDEMFEGIASWTTDLNYAKTFKGFIKPTTKFAMVFKHTPVENEIVVNILFLWKNEHFIKSADKFKAERPDDARALFNFKDYQSEIILKSTLKGNEIEDIVGISSSFEKLCDMAGIKEENRRELSIKYARNPDGIPIELPSFAGSNATKKAIKKTISKMTNLLNHAKANNIPINWGKSYSRHDEDLKHKLE